MSEVILYNSDCIQAMTEIADHSINLILTDPPYNLGNFMKSRDTNLKKMRDNFFGAAGWDNLEYDEWANAMDAFFAQAARVMKKGGSMIVFMAAIKVETTISLAEKHGFYYKTTGIWHKLNPMPRNMNLHFVNSTETWIYFTYKTRTGTFNNNGAVLHDFIETAVTPASERRYGKHPTQKPEVLMRFCLTQTIGFSILSWEAVHLESYRNEPVAILLELNWIKITLIWQKNASKEVERNETYSH